MERLTMYDAVSGYEICDPIDMENDYSLANYKKVAEKLGEYEDLEEQGLLLKLPCKVGDTIYKLSYAPCHFGNAYPDSFDCCGCEDECDLKRSIFEFVVPNTDWILTNMKHFGYAYFLTREEAAQKLKELGE